MPDSRLLQIRPMQEPDVQEVAEIERTAYAYPWTEGIFKDCLRVGYSAWVLEWRQRIGAYGVMILTPGESHLLNLCVRPEVQGMGLGRKMLEHLLGVARRCPSEILFLEVRPSNIPAIDLYRRFGFNEVGTRQGYYPALQGREDALILAMQLRVP
jgi:[ribosomal protein S18]-alanine N-acetyltransferase